MDQKEVMTKELSKADSKMIQGLSVMAMVWLHLFCTFDYEGKFQPLLFLQGLPLSFYIAQLCDFCVFGFAFISGYGHMAQYGKEGFFKSRLKGALSVLCCYWCVLAAASLLSILTGHGSELPKDAATFLLTATTIKSAYNGAWWYMFAFVLLSLLSPLLMNAVKKFHPIVVLAVGFVVYCTAYYVRFYLNADSILTEKYGPVGMTLFEYLLGAECLHLCAFSRLYKMWSRTPVLFRRLGSGAVILMMLYAHTKIVGSLFIAPVTGMVIITLFHFWNKGCYVEAFFKFMGGHSTNIWLTHMFFYTSVWGGIVFAGHFPLVIYTLMMVITVIVSMLLQIIETPLQNAIRQI